MTALLTVTETKQTVVQNSLPDGGVALDVADGGAVLDVADVADELWFVGWFWPFWCLHQVVVAGWFWTFWSPPRVSIFLAYKDISYEIIIQI